MRGLWLAALVVATMLVAMGTARAQFIGIPKPAPIVVTVTKSDQRMVVAVDGQLATSLAAPDEANSVAMEEAGAAGVAAFAAAFSNKSGFSKILNSLGSNLLIDGAKVSEESRIEVRPRRSERVL